MVSRKSNRFAVQLPLSFSTTDYEGEGTILNISREGCMVTAERVPEPTSYVRLDMRLREDRNPIHVELAAVRWSVGSKFGIEFIKVSPEHRLGLTSFLTMLERSA